MNNKITLGVCYYPEHWDCAMWREDMTRMSQCGIEVIRIAEFAWNKFEPEDGVFTFEFWDSFMSVAQECGMKVIFCTPTATAPIWLSEKYPEVLNADIDGNLIYHGTRRQNNLNSPIYRQYSARIVEKLAEHYVNHPAIIGWQLDNEINCEVDRYYSKSDHQAFREYCRDKYKTLEAFNEAMGTIVWNQTYTDWNQVHLTRRTNTYGQTNPHLQLEEDRFISDTVISYFKLQADIIRKWQQTYGVNNQFITSNGLFRYVDYHKLTSGVLDFMMYDNYPAFAFEAILDKDKTNGFKDRNSSFNLARTRSISPGFGIMEQQSGAGGWNCRMRMPMPRPGQMRLWTLQAIAHGADFVSYFRWRTARVGTEIYWHGLLDYDSRDNRRISELKQIHADVSKLSEVAGSRVIKRVGILRDYDNDWDGSHDIWHGPLDELSTDSFFRCLESRHIPFDFVNINDDTRLAELADYKLLIYPHVTIFSQARHDLLASYIANGGKVIFGARSGYKDLQGHCLDIPMPGLIADLTGCLVEEYTCLTDFDPEVKITTELGESLASEFVDVLEPTDGEVLGSFDEYFDGRPAIVAKKNGQGLGLYVGTAFIFELARVALKLSGEADFDCGVSAPGEVEIVIRQNGACRFTFVLNYENSNKQIAIERPMKNLLTGEDVSGNVELGAYDVLVLSESCQ